MIVLDIETTGIDPLRHCMLSLGAVDFDTGDEFYGECQVYPDRIIDDFALGINGFTREQCTDKNKPYPFGLYVSFLMWAAGREPLLAGQQVGSFDAKFLRVIHDTYNGEVIAPWPFGHRTVDLHSVAYSKFRKSMKLDEILVACGLDPEPKPHNALTGAKLEAECFKHLFITV